MPCVSALIMKIHAMCVVGADLCVCPHHENLYPIKKGEFVDDGKGANIQ